MYEEMASLSRSLSPSLSPHRSSSLPGKKTHWLLFIKQLTGIQELSDVLELLKKCGFSETRWFELGLALGLSKNTLDIIKADHPQNTHQCLIECLSKWLVRADDVDSKGGATWDSLSTGLRSINENAVVDKLDQEIRSELVSLARPSARLLTFGWTQMSVGELRVWLVRYRVSNIRCSLEYKFFS